jgi:hypothetical protein
MWPWSKKEPICEDCEAAKVVAHSNPDLPAGMNAPECAALYEAVAECMKRDRQSVKECAPQWAAFRKCHDASRRRD